MAYDVVSTGDPLHALPLGLICDPTLICDPCLFCDPMVSIGFKT